MQFSGIERELERFAWPQEVALPNDFVQGVRTQAFGQRHVCWARGRRTGLKQIVSHQ
jgi:hypothetical protein